MLSPYIPAITLLLVIPLVPVELLLVVCPYIKVTPNVKLTSLSGKLVALLSNSTVIFIVLLAPAFKASPCFIVLPSEYVTV